MRDVGHPMSMSMDFERVCRFWPGGKHHGRPMVSDTCEVRETTSCTKHNTSIAPQTPFRRSLLLHLPRMQKRAGGRSLRHFGDVPTSSTSLAGRHSSRRLCPPSSQASVLASTTSLASSRWRFDAVLASTSLVCQMTKDSSYTRTSGCMRVRPDYCLYQNSNLARLHGSVNWHSHCTCEVYWLVLGRYPWTGLGTRVFENPYPSLSKPAPLGADVGFRGYGYSLIYLSTWFFFLHFFFPLKTSCFRYNLILYTPILPAITRLIQKFPCDPHTFDLINSK